MSELKTLKDIGANEDECDINPTWSFLDCPIALKLKDELKAEAVKWVKFYQKMKRFDKEIAFRHFFNLTEEDLKDDTK